MAGNKIRGITIEIAGDTSKLSESLRKADEALKDTQKQLTDVNRLLKLDPKNTELLRQKTELLNKSIKQSEEKVKDLRKAQEALGDRTEENAAQYDAIEREIVACESAQKKWTKEVEAMQSPVKSLQDTLKDVSKTTGEWADKTRGLSLAAGAAAGGLLANAYAASKTADDYNTLARNTGFTVEELQKMRYASDFVDVSFDSMTGTITKLTKNMSSGSAAFDKLHVSIRDKVTGELRDASDVWYETLYALSKVENETERDALAMELFGKSAMDLSGIIDDGGVALVDYGNEAERAGLILSGDTMKAANELKDTVDKLKGSTTQALLEAGASLAQTLAPAVEKLVNLVTRLATWFGNLDGKTQAVIVTILALVSAISPVLGLISAITGAAAALNVAVLPLVGTIALVVVGIAALVAAGVALYQNWDTVCAWAIELKDKVVNAFNGLKDGAIGAFENLKSTVASVFDNIRNTISEKIEAAKKVVTDAVNTIKGAFNFSWSLPPLKLPHFHVSGGVPPWGLMGQGSLPKISIDWYKKAYQNAIMFNTPTVVPTMAGMKGFGDGNGGEMVVGNDLLAKMIAENSGAAELTRIESLLETLVQNPIMLSTDARKVFKVVRAQNQSFRMATGQSGFDR